MTTTTYARKDRTIRGRYTEGQTHVWTGHQTLCGRRLRGVKVLTGAAHTRPCLDCARHQENGTVGVYRHGR